VVFISEEAKTAVEDWIKIRDKYIKSAINRNLGLIEKAQARPKKQEDNRLFPFSDAVVRELWSNILTKAELYEKDDSTQRLKFGVHGLRTGQWVRKKGSVKWSFSLNP
jgi:hypothetical protein